MKSSQRPNDKILTPSQRRAGRYQCPPLDGRPDVAELVRFYAIKRGNAKQESCLGCNIYRSECNGERFIRTDRLAKQCANQVSEPRNKANKIQVKGFGLIHRDQARSGLDPYNALLQTICATSDDAMARATEKQPHLVRQWKDEH